MSYNIHKYIKVLRQYIDTDIFSIYCNNIIKIFE